jgi:hypothetical protein
MGGLGREFKCQGECQTDWRHVWERVLAIPAAAGMFIRWGINLPMSVGAIAMNLSTIIVALNAQFLRRVNLGP